MSLVWLNGEIVSGDEAKISVFDHGLLYGDGVFEGIRFYKQQAFKLAEHLKRLEDSADYISLTIPFDAQALKQAIKELIHAYGKDDGYIRLVVTRGKGPLGINPTQCATPNVFIIIDHLNFIPAEVMENGANVIIASTRRIAVDALDPRVKSLNYLNHILARLEANHANAHEAILLNAQGYVTEGSTDNIFITKNGQLLTPPVSDGALAGITRQTIIDLARDNNIDCQEKSLAPYDLYTADECFLTGTAVELIPVASIDSRKMKIVKGDMYSHLSLAFKKLVE